MNIDFTLMDAFEHENLWFIDILQDKKLVKKLKSNIKNPDDMEDVHNQLKKYYE